MINLASYPQLEKYCRPITGTKRAVLGRDELIAELQANLQRPEIANAILLGEAGVGKTAIVEELAKRDQSRDYLEVDLTLLADGKDGSTMMGVRMKKLVDEVQRYRQEQQRDLVLFMDEFHLIAEISSAALQAIKPVLARSGSLHVYIIAATTRAEYDEYIRGDHALDERLQPLQVEEPTNAVIHAVLRNMADTYIKAPDHITDDLIDNIIDVTNRYMPDEVQPRKSIRVLDAMIGQHRQTKDAYDMALLTKVFRQVYGININWKMDVNQLEDYLNNRVLNQRAASAMIAQRLYIDGANLSDPTRPQASFLFLGATGVGKTEMAKALTKVVFGNENRMIRIDMSEYSQSDSSLRFRELLTSQVRDHPYAVLLFDEIEKACNDVKMLLLQVLDDGRLIDRHNRITSFVNTYIIATSNAGSTMFEDIKQYDENTNISQYRDMLRQHIIDSGDFAPELLNRFDDFIMFLPLDEKTKKAIIIKRLQELKDQIYKQYHTTVVFDKRVVTYLLENMQDSTREGGGRAIMRFINNEIVWKIAQFLVTSPKHITTLNVNVHGKLATENPLLVVGGRDYEAYIEVGYPIYRERT